MNKQFQTPYHNTTFILLHNRVISLLSRPLIIIRDILSGLSEYWIRPGYQINCSSPPPTLRIGELLGILIDEGGISN